MRLTNATIWKAALSAWLSINLAGCATSIAEDPAAADEHEPPAVVVHVTPATLRTLEQHVKAIGQCEALVDKRAMLTPALEGHVHAILAAPGASVTAGQEIIALDPRLPAADLAEKQAMEAVAKASLALLESLPRTQEQRISKLAVEQATVALERAQSVLDGLKPLAARNEISHQQLFDAEKAVEQARLLRESAEKQFEVSMLGPRAEAVEEAKSRITIAQRAEQTAQARLDLHTLRAPIDGVLQDITCHLGQTVAAGTTVGEIVDTRQLYVMAWLPPRAAHSVRVGQQAEVSAATLDSPQSASTEEHELDIGTQVAEEISAEVLFVGQVADPLTGNLPVRVLVDNTDGRLSIGQTVSLAITVGEVADALSVPVAAVFDLGEGPLVNVIREGNATPLHPRLGLAHDGWIAVYDTDLEVGEPVVVEGGYNLKEDTPVTIEDSPQADAPSEPDE